MTTSRLPIAAFPQRLGAFIIDYSIVASISLVVFPLGIFAFAVFMGIDIANPETDPRIQDPQVGQLFQVYLKSFVVISSSILYWLYSALLESSKWHATIGKRILGLYVGNLDGSKLSFRKAALRAGVKIFCGIIPCGFISIPSLTSIGTFITCGMVLLTENRQGIHDKISRSLVLRRVDATRISVMKVQRDNAISVLFLAAEPTDASRLRLGEEYREIQNKLLHTAQLREQFELDQRMSVRPEDITHAFLDVHPKIVHFSGHGTSAGALCVENEVGKIQFIQPDALAALFKQFSGQIECVILNACHSEIQANAIAKYVPCVIGMNKAIGDRAAIAFSVGFYQALGAGRSIEDAYELGCVQIGLQGIPENLTPVLVKG